MADVPVLVHLLPRLIDPAQLGGGRVVVIDVLRASTVMCAATLAGAASVGITAEVDDARRLAAEAGPGVVLGGERGGTKIDGFDLGNSPDEYSAGSVGGRTLVFTTTNGTRAAVHARDAAAVAFGCFANLGAVVRWIAAGVRSMPVHLLCAGTEGRISIEDTLAAGAIAQDLLNRDGFTLTGDQAQLAAAAFRAAGWTERSLCTAIDAGTGAANIRRLGLDKDIAMCVRRDWCPLVPVVDAATLTVRAVLP